MDHRHVPPLGELAQAARERGDHLVLAGPEGVEVQRWPLKLNAPLLHLPGLREYAAHVQQRLGGNTAPQQARAAKPLVPLDKRHLHAEISGEKGGSVTTGSAAEHHHGNVHLVDPPPSGRPVVANGGVPGPRGADLGSSAAAALL